MKAVIKLILDYSWPQDHNVPLIPFAELQANPVDYYDTTTFVFPVTFTSPEVMKLGELFDFAGYLISISHCNILTLFAF